MTKAITDGLRLMPPPFAQGLDVWSSKDGTPGSPRLSATEGARIVPDDAEFGRCLEFGTSGPVARLRYSGETPILPGCYLRVRARVKTVRGALPSLRVAGWPGASDGSHVPGLVECGPAVAVAAHGEPVEVSAILGSGARTGVDMTWGGEAAYGHLGLDVVGSGDCIVRVEDLVIEDVTSIFLRAMLDVVDVRDYGATGDGTGDDAPAFVAADREAQGRTVLVPPGRFRLGSPCVLASRVRFAGRVSMAEEHRLVLRRSLDLATYEDAFGDPELALRKAVQALLADPDCRVLDLSGRRVLLSAPLDLGGAPAGASAGKRIRNGAFAADRGKRWAPREISMPARHDPAEPCTLRDVAAVRCVEVGALLEGAGVAPEVYVRGVDRAAGRVTLSRPPGPVSEVQEYRFRRFRHLVEGAGVDFCDVGFHGRGAASGALLSTQGPVPRFRDCTFDGIAGRGVTAPGGVELDGCRFAGEAGALGCSVAGEGAAIVGCSFERTGAALAGQGHRVAASRFRGADLVLLSEGPATALTGNLFESGSVVLMDPPAEGLAADGNVVLDSRGAACAATGAPPGRTTAPAACCTGGGGLSR